MTGSDGPWPRFHEAPGGLVQPRHLPVPPEFQAPVAGQSCGGEPLCNDGPDARGSGASPISAPQDPPSVPSFLAILLVADMWKRAVTAAAYGQKLLNSCSSSQLHHLLLGLYGVRSTTTIVCCCSPRPAAGLEAPEAPVHPRRGTSTRRLHSH